jgi:hypothetical protein
VAFRLLFLTMFLTGCMEERLVTFSERPLPPTDQEELEPTPTPTDIPTPIKSCSYKYHKKHGRHVYKCERGDDK